MTAMPQIQRKTPPLKKRQCETCVKKLGNDKCRVLLKNIGLNQECWAWSDDPDWKEKMRQACKNYKDYLEGMWKP